MRQQRLPYDRARVGATRAVGALLLVLAILGCASGVGSAAGGAMTEPCAGRATEATAMANSPRGTSSTGEHSCMSDHDRCPASRAEPAPRTPVPGADRDLPVWTPPTTVSPAAAPGWERAPGSEDSYELCVIRT
ncbi:hypothetical protein ACFYTG_39500 [Streptomyces mirabilis]|uniref:hypothetical protein n=1 Tax=Streptomyces mirabilis TaxID=68239 RepID=UPI003680DA67